MMVGGGQLSALSGPAGEQKRLGGGVWAKPGLPHGVKQARGQS